VSLMSEEEYEEVEFCYACRTQPANVQDIGGRQFECQDCGAIWGIDKSSRLGVKVIREPPEDW